MSTRDDIAAIWRDIELWLREHAPDRAEELRPGVAAAAIEKLETAVGRKLPEDYAASLAIHDGRADLSDYTYMPLDSVEESWRSMTEQAKQGAFAGREIDNPDAAIIQRAWWHEAWIPFAEDSGGNMLCLDLEPGPNGAVGQVLRFERAMGPGPAGWPSFAAWLSAYRDGLRDGSYEVDEDGFIRDAG